jgi:transposase
MHRIRTVKTSSGATAVQVVRYVNRKTIVDSHIGSSKNSDDILRLKEGAYRWIEQNAKQLSLFPLAKFCDESDAVKSSLIPLAKCRNLGFRYQLLYETLDNLANLFKFHLLPNRQIKLLTDLVLTRIVSPSSKLESLKFLKRYFNVSHSYRTLSRALPTFIMLKDEIESKVITIAKKHFGFNFSLVFYDLTTLYFESFETDEIRRIGFSKDNKSANPQVMIGLLVNDLGFPISYQLFAGNKFEGHTLMPSILSLKKKHKIKQMTVVADSAMISDDNIKFLQAEKLDYIVAARTANLSIQTIDKIAKDLNQQDEASIRIKTESKGDLILHFSSKRYKKEKAEMEKQLEKAKLILKTPSKAEIIKRTKFLRGKKLGYELNTEMIHKANLLLGIKGYYSNCDNLTNEEIIGHYKDLWRVEQAFRISKSDLKARPIFHNKQQAIETHILICFMALALAKYIEIKTKRSIKFVTNELKEITDAHLYDELNNREIIIRSEVKKDVREFLDKILSH